MGAAIDQLIQGASGGDLAGGDEWRVELGSYQSVSSEAPLLFNISAQRIGGSDSGPTPRQRVRSDVVATRKLELVLVESSMNNWDNDGAPAIPEVVATNSRQFLQLLTNQSRVPDNIYADPVGRMIFEWRDSRGGIIDVSIGATSGIAYAWAIGVSEGNGVDHSTNEIPPAIESLLTRLLAPQVA
jgi:hypothetical protein